MSVVHQAIENGVGKGRIADDLVPMFDWKLAGHHGRSAAVPILHDLQEVAPLLGGYGSKSPIVEDEKLDASQALEEPSVMAVAACKRERIEEPRRALIEDGAVIPTGFVAERAGNPTLADAGGADDEQILMPFDPFAKPTFAMLTDQTRILAKDRPLAALAIKTIEKCRALQVVAIALLPNQTQQRFEGFFREQDSLNAQLYLGKITIGEYNVGINRIATEGRKALFGDVHPESGDASKQASAEAGGIKPSLVQPQAQTPPIQQFHQTRVALVIGNSNYKDLSRLTNPANDAPAILERFAIWVSA